MALFGGFSSLFSSIHCFFVNLMHARFQFCKQNQSNSFLFDVVALFQNFDHGNIVRFEKAAFDGDL